MLYFIAKFALYLVLAGVLGVIIGWLIWGGEAFESVTPVMSGDDADQVSELGAQIESKDQEIARLRKRLKRVHADLDARDSHVLAAKATHEELSGMLGTREDELMATRRDYDALLEQAQAGAGGVVTDPQMVRRMSELEEDLASSRSESGELSRQLETARAATAEAGAATGGDSDEHIAAQVDAAVAQRVQAEVDAALQQSRREAADQAEQAQAQLAATEAQRVALHQDLQAAHQELDQAAMTIVAHEESLASLSEAAQRGAQAATGAAAVAGASPDMSRIRAELERAKRSLSTWRTRLDEVEEENDRLAGDLAAVQSELSTRGSQGAGLAEENERMTAELASLRNDLAASHELLDDRQRALADAGVAQAERDRLAEENDRLVAEAGRLRNGVIGLDERAAKAEAEAARLCSDLAGSKAATESQLSVLHVELSDARLRADAAHEALQDLTQEFVSFREITIRQQTTVQSLSDRLDRARSTLVGRRPGVEAPSRPSEGGPPLSDDLSALPGATPTLLAHLAELGVTSYVEIGQWAPADVERYELTLAVPGVIRDNAWPEVARSMWETKHNSAWSDHADSRS